jgi:hypothetical protein
MMRTYTSNKKMIITSNSMSRTQLLNVKMVLKSSNNAYIARKTKKIVCESPFRDNRVRHIPQKTIFLTIRPENLGAVRSTHWSIFKSDPTNYISEHNEAAAAKINL